MLFSKWLGSYQREQSCGISQGLLKKLALESGAQLSSTEILPLVLAPALGTAGPRRPAALAIRFATDVEAIAPLAPLALRARRAGRVEPMDALGGFLADLAVEALLAGALAAEAFLAGAFAAEALLAGAFAVEAFLAGAFAVEVFLAGAFAVEAFLAGAFVASVLLLALLAPRLRWVKTMAHSSALREEGLLP